MISEIRSAKIATNALVWVEPERVEGIKTFLGLHPNCTLVQPSGGDDTYQYLDVQFNIYFSFRDTRKLKKSLKNRGGILVEISTLSKKPPLFDEALRRILRDCTIVGVITFLTALGGNSVFAKLNWESMIGIAIIPALTAFFTKLALDLKVTLPSASSTSAS
jgi:hypothetical protein